MAKGTILSAVLSADGFSISIDPKQNLIKFNCIIVSK